MARIRSILLSSTLLLAAAGSCSYATPWNDPYPADSSLANTLYASFAERPKHLDPARSYAYEEYVFIAQIYEPPLQYHFLKRPYQLVPLTLVEMPRVTWWDEWAIHLAPVLSICSGAKTTAPTGRGSRLPQELDRVSGLVPG